jgi:hypothetical protein
MPLIRTPVNRANVRHCTGPRSREGKARVAQNAFRHGLARAIASDEPWSEPMGLLIDAIVGGDRHEERLHLAMAIAEPVMEVMRVRRARQALLDVAFANPTLWPGSPKGVWPSQARDACGREASARGLDRIGPSVEPLPPG